MPQRRGAVPISDAEILSSPDTYARGVPFDRLDRLRAKTPVTWLDGRLDDDAGSWAVLRYADVRRALDRPELFLPVQRGSLHGPSTRGDASRRGEEAAVASMLIDMEPQPGALLDRVGKEPVDLVREVLGEQPETLRNTLAGGVYALLRNQGEYERLRADPGLLDSAVEEMLRWWTPVMWVRRTVRRATELGGVPLHPDERVTLWLVAANNDEDVFPEPRRFAPDRFAGGTAPRPLHDHLSFGHGVHACLGARLARVHLRALVGAILERPERLVPAGEPIRLRSSARHGFDRLPVRWTV
ncbi:cytochrome P450 [Spirillospora sp. CA-294931]|uniref:cytochrome P450 n=1 Tax=Spirillospora sp. CA-294931 TaxID=3240042 RepID=UPI003D92CCB3